MATLSVGSKSELLDVLATANGGDVIELAAGHYGDLWVHDLDFSSEVVIKSADPNDPAVFGTAKIQFVTNLTLDGVFVDFVPDETTTETHAAVTITDSSSITIRNSNIEGGPSVAGISQDSEAGQQSFAGIQGLPIGRGVTALRSDDLVFENNEISNFFKGIVIAKVDGAQILGNDVHDLRGSPLVGADLSGITVDSNHFYNSNPWSLGGAGDHADMIHFWVDANQTDPNSDIVISNNFFDQGDGAAIYGVFFESGSGSYSNVVIDGNVLLNGESQGFVLAAVDGLQVTNNTMLQSSGGQNDAPKIQLLAGTKNAIIENNITAGIFGTSYDASDAHNVSIAGNLFVNYDDPENPLYAGNFLILSEHSTNSLENVRIVPGSLADGIGSPLTMVDTTPDHLAAGFNVHSSADNGETLVFDASDLTFGPAGLVDENSAEFTWDFGDGTTSTGAVVQRTYTEPGRYNVVLTVESADGETSTASYEVGVAGDALVSYDSAAGEFISHGYGELNVASSTIENTVSSGSETAIALGGTGVQARLSKSAFQDLFGADNFDLSFSFKSTAGSASSGEIFRIHGSMVASIDEDGHLVFQMSPADSPLLTAISTGPSLNDGQVHDVLVVFEGENNMVSILVDGNWVGTLHPETNVRADYPQDVMFGNPWGGTNFQGQLLDFSISSYKPDYKVLSDGSVDPNTSVEEDHTSIPTEDTDDVVVDVPEVPDNEEESGGDTPVDEEVTDVPTGDRGDVVVDVPEVPDDEVEPDRDTPVEEETVNVLKEGVDDVVLDFTEVSEDGRILKDDATVVPTDDGLAISFDGDGDFAQLGRKKQLEDSQKLSISVDFQQSEDDDRVSKIFWKKDAVGLKIVGDDLVVRAQTAEDSFKTFVMEDVIFDEPQLHHALVMVDGDTDRMQVVLDGVLILDETSTDFDIASNSKWKLSAGGRFAFDGEISDFRIEDDVSFVPVGYGSPETDALV